MQTLNFTQKLLRPRRFLGSLIPLLALFVGLGTSFTAQAQGPAVDDVEVIFSAKPTGASSAMTVNYAGAGALDAPYTGYTKLGSSNPASPTPSLGTYSIDPGNSTMLLFTGSSLVAEPLTVRGVTTTPVSARLRYRAFLVGTSLSNQPSFTLLPLGNPRSFPGFPAATLFDATTSVNLLSGLLSGGTYVFEARFEATYSDGAIQQATGNTYTANFTVTAPAVTPPGGTTTWISQSSNNWLLPANWSNGVPNSTSDAVIPEKSPDPAINTVTPVLLDQDSTIYNVRNLTLDGGTNSSRALLRIGQTTGGVSTGATLNVYGDLNVISSGILGASVGAPGASRKARNSTIVLRGGNQKVKGTLNIADLVINGTGTKAIVNVINVNNTLVFDPSTSAGVLMETVTELSDGSVVFNTTGTPQLKLNGTIVSLLSRNSSETNNSYVRGVTIAQRTIFRNLTAADGTPVSQIGVPNTFGNIGLDIVPRTLDSDPIVTITRTVGDPLFAPTFPGRTPNPVKRQYGVSGDINNAPNVSDIVFHYLDSADELNGNNDESQLVIFRATNNGPPYALVGGTPNTAANTVTRTSVTNINTITLGSKNNPLPVTVVSFDAKRVGADALLSWSTAQETNNKGFNLQVSSDAKSYRTIGFVASDVPNSSSAHTYSFLDTEKNKSGVRYYRLQQVDLDGKTAQFAPRAITFEGRAATEAGNGIAAYPNPYTSTLRVSLNSTVSGDATARITDMTGRLINQQVLPITIGSNDVPVESISDLKSGLYILNIMLPSGEKKTVKVTKQ